MPFDVVECDHYLELRLAGPLDEDGWASRSGLLSNNADRKRFLLNFSDATAVSVPTNQLVRSAERIKGRDWRIAILAPRPEFFGLARQTIQLAALPEGESVNVLQPSRRSAMAPG